MLVEDRTLYEILSVRLSESKVEPDGEYSNILRLVLAEQETVYNKISTKSRDREFKFKKI